MHNIWKHNLDSQIFIWRYSMICSGYVCAYTFKKPTTTEVMQLYLHNSESISWSSWYWGIFIHITFLLFLLLLPFTSPTQHRFREANKKNKRIGWKCQLSHSWDKVNIWFGFIHWEIDTYRYQLMRIRSEIRKKISQLECAALKDQFQVAALSRSSTLVSFIRKCRQIICWGYD